MYKALIRILSYLQNCREGDHRAPRNWERVLVWVQFERTEACFNQVYLEEWSKTSVAYD